MGSAIFRRSVCKTLSRESRTLSAYFGEVNVFGGLLSHKIFCILNLEAYVMVLDCWTYLTESSLLLHDFCGKVLKDENPVKFYFECRFIFAIGPRDLSFVIKD